MDYLFWLLISYIIGSLPVGYWFGKLKGIDLTQIGSGSTGATNVLRNVGKWPALVTLLFDLFKGFIIVCLAMKFQSSNLIVVLSGIACIIGHSKSVFLKFKGGKSSATGLGILIVLSWKIALISLLIWLIVVLTSKYSSLGSIIATPLVPIWFYFFHKPRSYIYFGVFAAVYIVLIRHRENIVRLIKGTEPRIGDK